ncbi:four helix bundle protein [Sandaracinus amylolyticus]|uniref:four helix bundle protein n=1 Tax=Sandaracinus amylolyticus TaxID=927083 RepID=UPI001F294C2F|nr:four helix bundle protein [Sandaracinus amylolyticus]UJR82033.1 Four helix bundle protein [Sandaracinus amylolyticus]
MLKVYTVARQALRRIGAIATLIEKHDGDLARQMRRAGTSVLLNLREGSQSQGRNRNARYWNAAGSANEVLGCLDCAEDLGYVRDVDPSLRAELNHVVGVTVRVARGVR